MSTVALVTGGGRGLGRDIAISLARSGHDVVLTYHSRREEAENVAQEIAGLGRTAVALLLDVADIPVLDAFVGRLQESLRSTFGTLQLDFLVNDAGFGQTVAIADVDEDVFDRFVDVHFKGVFFLTQKILPMMAEGGGIVFITAGATRFVVPGYAVYAACKSATESLARYVAKEHGSRGIRANIVAPGGIETDFNGAAIRNNPHLQTYITAQTALGRVGRPDDIGGAVSFLCSRDAKWVNGQRLEVSGGIHL